MNSLWAGEGRKLQDIGFPSPEHRNTRYQPSDDQHLERHGSGRFRVTNYASEKLTTPPHSPTDTQIHRHPPPAPTRVPSQALPVPAPPVISAPVGPGRTQAGAGQSPQRPGGGRDLERLPGGQALAASQPAACRPDPPRRRRAGARELGTSELGPEAFRPVPAPRRPAARRLLLGSIAPRGSRAPRDPPRPRGQNSARAGSLPRPHRSPAARPAPALGDARGVRQAQTPRRTCGAQAGRGRCLAPG